MNWWLIGLAFALGLVLTALFMVRRVTEEVPDPDAPALAESDAVRPDVFARVVEPEVVEPEVVEPKPDPPDAPVEPHGPGSALPNTDGLGPQGWTVKANEESKLYHSPESPSFGITRAEVWFRDVETAEAAGFNRWDSGKSQRGMKPRG
ncbi:MAG: hypothetical protein ABW001_09420 [Mycobacterium sp.]